MVPQRGALLLLFDDARQMQADFIRQHHAVEFGLGIGAVDKPLQFAARARHRDRRLPLGRRHRSPLITGFLDEALQLVGFVCAAFTRFLSCDL